MSSAHQTPKTSHLSSLDPNTANYANRDINQTDSSNQIQTASGNRNRSVSASNSKSDPSSKLTSSPLRRSSTVTGRMTRKRTAEEAESLQSDQDPERDQTDSAGPATAHICLCQPAPKIPRPRNGACT
jgi:hypothetical protein